MSLNIIIIGITVIISILSFSNSELFNTLKFNAYFIKERKEGWRFFSYALVHSGWMHLLINMWVLYSFGEIVEQILMVSFKMKGVLYFFLLYLGGILFSTLFDFGKHKNDPYYNAVGASGAVSAVVFASILLYPEGSIFVFPIPFSLPSWVFGILYLIYSAYMGQKGTDSIGHNAHFWGAIFGLVFIIILIPSSIENFFSAVF
jgi:membrane associated rhomboid family serine protease